MPAEYSLKPGDYVVFGLSLLVSSIIGFVFACRGDRLRKTPNDLLLGGGTMHPVPVAMSLLASSLNAVFIIGTPAEVYYYGVTYCYVGLAFMAVIPVTAHFFVPIFRGMKVISIYEYLERRFNVFVRVLASATYVIAMSVFLGVVLYAPALTFSQVTGLPLFMAVAICGLVCTKYTVLGGIQAVIWVDVFQLGIVLVALVVLTSAGTAEVGSSSKVWDRADEGGRLNFNEFDPDPTVRHSFWTQTIGMFFVWLPLFTTNQMMIQRYLTVKSTRDAQKSLYLVLLIVIVILALVVALGLVMYGYYHDCDPSILDPPRIGKRDQIVPLFMMELLGKYEGVPGLFMASVFAAALSSVSSALNSVSAVILEDFVKVVVRAMGKKMEPKTAGWTSRAIALLFGFLMLGLSFIADTLSSSIITIPATIWGVIGGPLLAIFILGFFVPCCNSAGAMSGLVVSLCVNLWLMIGNLVVWDKNPEPLILSTACQVVPPNGTTVYYSPAPPSMESTASMLGDDESTLDKFYQISYVWYGLIGLVVALVVGLLVSWFTEGIKAACHLGAKLPPDTVFGFADRCCCCCPPSVQDSCRCGVPVVTGEGKDDEEDDEDVAVVIKSDADANEEPSSSRKRSSTEANGFVNPSFESSDL